MSQTSFCCKATLWVKILIAGVLALFHIQASATTIYYFPSDFDGTNRSPTDVSQIANFQPLCQGTRGPRLPGLDLVRAFSGASTCQGTSSDTQFNVPVDYVFLVDDTAPLSAYLRQEFGGKQLLKDYRGRQVIDSQTRSFERNGEDSGLDILIVGETDYRTSGANEASWFVGLSDQTGNTACEIPEAERQIIADFATQTYQMNEAIVSTMQNALNNFETRMSFDSSYAATPQVGAALGREAIKQVRSYIVGKIGAQVPGFGLLVGFVDTANQEIARAEGAARSNSMGDWIITTRTFISNCLGNSRCSQQASSTVEQLSQVTIRDQVEIEVCRMPANRKAAGMEAVSRALNSSLVGGRESIQVFEKGFYEAWINSKYQASSLNSDSAQGTIEVVWEVEEENGLLVFDGDSNICKVNISDYGDKADDGLNDIISALPAVTQPWDFKVRKKVCFYVDNVMPGGRSRECALLDKDNTVLTRIGGSTDMARRAFQSPTWRRNTQRFKR